MKYSSYCYQKCHVFIGKKKRNKLTFSFHFSHISILAFEDTAWLSYHHLLGWGHFGRWLNSSIMNCFFFFHGLQSNHFLTSNSNTILSVPHCFPSVWTPVLAWITVLNNILSFCMALLTGLTKGLLSHAYLSPLPCPSHVNDLLNDLISS